MTTQARDLIITVLLTAAWITLTLGIATADRSLTYASAPSLGAALILHIAGMRRRAPKVENVQHLKEAQR